MPRARSRSREPSEGRDPENVMRGYKATLRNPNVSQQAKQHAQQELDRYESGYATSKSEEDRHASNVKRGLKAATHNPNVTDMGKKQARDKLQAMGEQPEEPGD
ncbi:hypothetical protein KXW98_008895 [Aspergillus fumigatus]|uniref:Conidiation protein Con-6 n=1 Tax=Aspergillus fumigatus (strain CBS 144.89 / FGSC A1163 / CEA10) TaxID=451804 RepID=B0YEJ7_ASPFC|nr:conserved hypothetical protein [Aspergillus fumigatus A1163]KAF4256996.1 hypothetical protein CNMCM8714_003211 [Aspergillus fumigatus]KMK58111.1 Conidiation-specific protein [Aspergillus fumigatus Z5]KAF4257285.1 hypothetical protein CNMCM8057_003734 [Aspergillus fumigatus]KAF4264764.1 hypothetical protein CNMCM8812_003426 [Aspergillus fumigatus]